MKILYKTAIYCQIKYMYFVYLAPEQKLLISPNFASVSNFNPQNT